MMKNFNKSILIFSFFALLVFTSCQDEITELPTDQETDTITANSEVAELVSLTTLRDGSRDNIIDRASCSSVVLPVTVVVHDIEIKIDSEADLQLIENLYDEFEDDIDELDILFPITVILSNYTEVVIESSDHLDTIIAECAEDDDDIECLDFEYPISISVFDANNEIAETKTFDNDERLYYFFKELKENEFVSFNFPMGLIDAEGTRINIENNDQLADALRIAKNECDEDDDNDYNDDDFDIERLNNYLVTCPWIIDHVRRNAVNQTEQYLNVYLVFRENGTVEAKFQSGDIEGTWETVMTDRGPVIALTFEDAPAFTNEWVVYEIGEGKIKFYDSDSDKIILEKRCEDPEPEFTEEQLDAVISECEWVVAAFNYNNEDVTAQYQSYSITFNGDGSVLASEDDFEVTGTWSTQTGVYFLWDMNEPLQELNNDWKLVEMSEERVKFVAGDSYVVLERDCETQGFTQNDVEIIKDYVASFNWVVDNYTNEQGNNTAVYSDFQLNFDFEAGTVIATNGEDEIEGTWTVALDGDMFMELNFGEVEPFNSFNENWKIVEYSESIIQLSYGGDTTLKFETVQ